MSRQSSIESYFQCNKIRTTVCSPKSTMKAELDSPARKRSLSLKKELITPSKSMKLEVDAKNESIVIDLCSDDDFTEPKSSQQKEEMPIPVVGLCEDYQITMPTSSSSRNGTPPTPKANNNSILLPSDDIPTSFQDNSGYDSGDSQKTVIYSPIKPQLTPQKLQLISPTSKSPSSTEFRSPQSGKKYFSPNKKRAVYKKSTVRKSLIPQLDNCCNLENDEVFNEACAGYDDKTVFFLTIINKCISDSSLLQLLAEESQQLLSKCLHTVKPGMQLVCRLYWFKQKWYKLEKLKDKVNVDDPSLQEALKSLQISGFVTLAGTNGHNLTFDDYADILSADDMKQICKDLKLKIKSKEGAIASLKEYSKTKSISNFCTGKTGDNSTRVLKIMNQKAGPCYKLSEIARKTIHDLYILMYLGINYDIIREKNLELTLLHDKTKQETYPVEEEMLDNASVVFRNRTEFERYVMAHNINEEYLIEPNVIARCETVTKVFDLFKNISVDEVLRLKALSLWLRRYTPLHIYISILESGVQDLKKENKFGTALEILDALIVQDMCRQHKKATWYAEKALVLHRCNRSDEAVNVLLEGFKSNLSEEHKDALRPRAKLIANLKRLNIDEQVRNELLDYANKDDILENNLRGTHITKQPMDRTQSKGKLKFETRTPSGERIVQEVEEYCLSHYISRGEFTDGIHCEGRLITTMFFLLFWDIIYSKPAGCVGVYLTRFQRYPLDLFHESFYDNRKEAIEKRLTQIEESSDADLLEMLADKWTIRPETEQSGIVRTGLTFEQLSCVAGCLGARGAAALCRRLACGYRYAHSGFPDLTLWNMHTHKIRFVEVKTDSDKPSLKQLQWMHYLQQSGLDVEFCYVGVHTTRTKARPVS